MAALANKRHEAFCQAFVKGEHAGNAAACYKLAYGKNNRARASTLLNTDKNIKARIATLQNQIETIETKALEAAIEKTALTKEWVIERLIKLAKTAGESAAVRSLELLGKHLGMFVERVQVSEAQYAISDEPMTPEEWRKEFTRPN